MDTGTHPHTETSNQAGLEEPGIGRVPGSPACIPWGLRILRTYIQPLVSAIGHWPPRPGITSAGNRPLQPSFLTLSPERDPPQVGWTGFSWGLWLALGEPVASVQTCIQGAALGVAGGKEWVHRTYPAWQSGHLPPLWLQLPLQAALQVSCWLCVLVPACPRGRAEPPFPLCSPAPGVAGLWGMSQWTGRSLSIFIQLILRRTGSQERHNPPCATPCVPCTVSAFQQSTGRIGDIWEHHSCDGVTPCGKAKAFSWSR